jgi:predicted dehydrogenase
MEVLGPEYSMSVNTLSTELSLFFSRELRQIAERHPLESAARSARSAGQAEAAGVGPRGIDTREDLVEKQNAELGLMPVVADETAAYGYVDENRHMVQAFRTGSRPRESFDDGVNVTELLMAAYMSAERGASVDFETAPLDGFVPAVARGVWNPRK